MPKTVPVTMPEQEGSKSVIEKWLKKSGEFVSIHEPLVEISTDKVTIEISSPATGELHKILKQDNEEVLPGEKLAEILLFGDETVRTSAPIKSPVLASATQEKQVVPERKLLSPAVRKLLRKNNLDVALIQGTGKNGRVTHKDVTRYIANQKRTSKVARPPVGIVSKDVSTTKLRKEDFVVENTTSKLITHSPMRKQIANHMVQSMLKTAPHVTAIFEANMTNIIAHRNKNKEAFAKQGIKLTFTSYFAIASALAIQEVPEVNSRWHDDHLEVFSNCNIGIATAIDKGLIVPVIDNVQNLSLIGVASELQKITDKARSNILSGNDVKGGTFTITNHGVSGSLIATPIINQPQSAILGIGKMQKRVVVAEINGQDAIQIQPMIYVTLTIDHRALDGFQANKFLTAFVDVIENWQ